AGRGQGPQAQAPPPTRRPGVPAGPDPPHQRRSRGRAGDAHGVLLPAVNRYALVLSLCALGCAREVRPAAQPGPAIAPEELETRLYLIGDAGKPAPGGDPVLAALSRQIASDPGKSFVVFLGDNVYPRGMAPRDSPRRPQDERRLSD